MQIPIIDFNPFINGDTVAKEAVATQISLAIHEVGCFYLKNYGISKTLITQVFSQAECFLHYRRMKRTSIFLSRS